MFRFACLAAPIVALSACAGQAFLGDRVIQSFIDEGYEPSYVSVFAGGGGEAAIYGSTRDGASSAEIAAAMRLPAAFSPRRITAGPTGERSGGHLVLVFAPESSATPKKACRGEVRGGTAGAELRVLGVFCSSFGRPVTEGVLISDGSPTPSDPGFQRTMSVLLNKILPFRNPNFQGDGVRVGG